MNAWLSLRSEVGSCSALRPGSRASGAGDKNRRACKATSPPERPRLGAAAALQLRAAARVDPGKLRVAPLRVAPLAWQVERSQSLRDSREVRPARSLLRRADLEHPLPVRLPVRVQVLVRVAVVLETLRRMPVRSPTLRRVMMRLSVPGRRLRR